MFRLNRTAARALSGVVLALVVAAAAAPPSPSVTASQPTVARGNASVRDLAADERRGGHTLARHVGKSDIDLRDRLNRERGISAASTYTDLATASLVVGRAIAQSARRISDWEARQGPRPNLVVNYVQTTGPPIGRSIRRGQRTADPCARALVVLRWDERRADWYVLTSYPESAR